MKVLNGKNHKNKERSDGILEPTLWQQRWNELQKHRDCGDIRDIPNVELRALANKRCDAGLHHVYVEPCPACVVLAGQHRERQPSAKRLKELEERLEDNKAWVADLCAYRRLEERGAIHADASLGGLIDSALNQRLDDEQRDAEFIDSVMDEEIWERTIAERIAWMDKGVCWKCREYPTSESLSWMPPNSKDYPKLCMDCGNAERWEKMYKRGKAGTSSNSNTAWKMPGFDPKMLPGLIHRKTERFTRQERISLIIKELQPLSARAVEAFQQVDANKRAWAANNPREVSKAVNTEIT